MKSIPRTIMTGPCYLAAAVLSALPLVTLGWMLTQGLPWPVSIVFLIPMVPIVLTWHTGLRVLRDLRSYSTDRSVS